MSEPIEIIKLNRSGEGLTTDGKAVPFTVPGDVIQLGTSSALRPEKLVKKGPWRVAAKCRHFEHCGGCSLQHLSSESYHSWKSKLISSALAQQGVECPPLDEIRSVGPGTRRRASLKAKNDMGRVTLGFYAPHSHELVDVLECPVLVPKLARALPKLRSGLEKLLSHGEAAELHLTHTRAGLDVSLKWKRSSGPDIHFALADFAQELELARLSWNGDPVSVARAPYLRMGAHTVLLPVKSFLQPTSEGETMLQSLVLQGVEGAKHIADLFAGCGTFALALGDGCTIRAVEENAAMVAALSEAASGIGSDVIAERRDLFRRPLLVSELAKFDVVILDPPRPGAKGQAQQLADSKVPRIVYVSCNPSSFARDARILCAGGYKIQRIAPVDQFLWSAHVELVAYLERDTKL